MSSEIQNDVTDCGCGGLFGCGCEWIIIVVIIIVCCCCCSGGGFGGLFGGGCR